MSKELRLLEEIDEYLNSNPRNSICSGSIFHHAVKEALEDMARRSHNHPSLHRFQAEVGDWRKMTINDTLPAHVAKVVDECMELNDHPKDPKEAADIMILLLALANRLGYDLLEETKDKFKEIQNYVWGPPDVRGVVRHLGYKDDSESFRNQCEGQLSMVYTGSGPCPGCGAQPGMDHYQECSGWNPMLKPRGNGTFDVVDLNDAAVSVEEFFKECCTINRDVATPSKLIYERYVDYCGETGMSCLSPKGFHQLFLKQNHHKGIFHTVKFNVMCWKGISLNPVITEPVPKVPMSKCQGCSLYPCKPQEDCPK